MNVPHWLAGAFAATVILTTLEAGAQGLGLTRMSIPYVLGTMITPNRDRAKLYGLGVHLVMGQLFALVYFALFDLLGHGTWWIGAAFGVVHALFTLTAGTTILPALHPRMASEQHGPTAARLLEPPGFLALHYGLRTPVAVILAHAVYGAVLGLAHRM